jgi:hypothetical protein
LLDERELELEDGSPELDELLEERELLELELLSLDELEDDGAGAFELLDEGVAPDGGADELEAVVGPVGDSLAQPPRTPTPARAIPPDRTLRNSRRSSRFLLSSAADLSARLAMSGLLRARGLQGQCPVALARGRRSQVLCAGGLGGRSQSPGRAGTAWPGAFLAAD